MKTPPPELTERLKAAGESFLTDDPPPRLEDVARAIGASRASLYYYFSGRDDLVTFLITQHARDAGAALTAALERAGDDPADRLEAALDGLTAFLAAHPGLCSGVLGSMGATSRLNEVMAINGEWVAGPLTEVVAAAMPRTSSMSAAETTSSVLGGLLLGVLARWSAGADPTDAGFRAGLVRQATKGVMG